MKDIGERSAGNPPAAFDEGRQEKSYRLLYRYARHVVSDEEDENTEAPYKRDDLACRRALVHSLFV
jgi:hypothetical protein